MPAERGTHEVNLHSLYKAVRMRSTGEQRREEVEPQRGLGAAAGATLAQAPYRDKDRHEAVKPLLGTRNGPAKLGPAEQVYRGPIARDRTAFPLGGGPRVLITNAEERSMLAACRSLHREGFEVTCVSASTLACAGFSRACGRRVRIVAPGEDSERFLTQLHDELCRNPCQMLLPGSDSALLAISRGREHLRELTSLGLPNEATVERALDRTALAESAAHAGLAGAGSIRCAGVKDALDAAAELGFPVVLKSARAASYRLGRATGAPKSRPVRDAAELRDQAPLFGGELLVQRRLIGKLLSFGGVFAGSRLLGVAVSRYKRTWPPPGGSVSFSATIDPPDGLEEGVSRLLKHIGWEGIFELELIQSATGEFVPIDLNPRPYGSMALASAAGAPLAAIWCDWLLKRDRQPVYARAGCRYRWEDGELRHLLWQARHGRLGAALRPLRPHRGVTHANFERADPLPLLAQGGHLARKAIRSWYAARGSTGARGKVRSSLLAPVTRRSWLRDQRYGTRQASSH